MTLEQAIQLKEYLNKELERNENTSFTYSVYPFWTGAAEKLYNVILFPLEYKEKYETADTSGQLSVVRVSIKTQSAGSQTVEDFINNFNANVLLDPEANNLLNKNK